jgi:D-serine deaminase-like pyridoxal phosphate-dependent protein
LSPDLAALRDVETPALVVDLSALERNIAGMSATAKRAGLALRPHAKTHKSAQIAARQIEAGAVGIACATVAEAEMLAAAGIGRLLLTAPVMGESKFARIARIHRERDITVVVDHPRQMEGLAGQLGAGDRPLPVVVDMDVGQARTGVSDIAAGVQLAQAVAAQPKLQFAGIQGYAGHAQHIADPGERKIAASKAAHMLRGLADALSQAGLRPCLITGSGTGTYRQDCEGPYNELQVGSYIFMDSDYARIVDETGAGPAFEPSLFVLATVVSVNRPGEVTVDAGTKALATNGPPPRHIIGAASGAVYRFAGDEHGIIIIPPGQMPPALGDRLLIGATHCDPTVNLHPCYHVVSDGVMQVWPIRARYGT